MQISSSTAYTPQSAIELPVNTESQVNRQGDQLLVRDERNQQPRQQNNEQQQQQRFDVDQQSFEQAVALVEREQSFARGGADEQPNAQAQYDQPPQRNQNAVSAYQSVEFSAQRENVEKTFGVDLYA